MAINALGYCEDRFNPEDPGRLCRGRERWVESAPLEEEIILGRVVISGAAFSDESANDALRGLPFSGLRCGEVLAGLFPGRTLHALAEDAHPSRLPEGAAGVEQYTISRPAGPLRTWAARWTLTCETPAAIDTAIAAGADAFVVRKDPPAEVPLVSPELGLSATELPPMVDAEEPIPSALSEGLRQRMFLLTGFRQPLGPGRRFQAGALPEVLQYVDAVVLVHQDKHAPCLGIYTLQPWRVGALLQQLTADIGTLLVPFAIPPMLARWDRALWELRQGWQGDFPVPPAPEGVQSWGRRSRGADAQARR